jgi:tetratricopeptide (TPR) repeat protein
VQIDPSQKNAHLYLAEALDRQGQPVAAIPHYQAFLQMPLAQRKEQSESPGREDIPVMVKLGDDLSHINQTATAIEAYGAALTLAEHLGDKPLQSLVLAHAADLQDKTGQTAAAAQSYQRGLALDQGSADNKTEGFDWFNYGQFLRRHGQPPELSLACYLQAENLLESTPGQELETARKFREQLENNVGGKSALVRKDLAGYLAKALSLTPSAVGAR